MNDRRRQELRLLGVAVLLVVCLVVLLDLLTNSIDTQKFSWDFRYYIRMARRGLTGPMASPFAYRYLTPLLVRGLSGVFGLSTFAGFRVVAYFGAVTQLLAVFMFIRWYTRSNRGAWLATAITALSLFNVKFLLFDTFRPDHLAYPLILLQAYFALTGRFAPLLVSTIIATQIREFNAVPLIAYMYSALRSLGPASTAAESRRTAAELAISVVGLGAALILPRQLIPVTENFQYADLSQGGILRVLIAPLVLARDANFIYAIVAYLLPVLMLAGPRELYQVIGGIARRDRIFLGAYAVIVLAMSFNAGTDFFRFSTYLLLPQAIVLGLLADRASGALLAIILASTFVFNRIWLPFPMSDTDAYLDFYGGFGARFNSASAWRTVECVALLGIGLLARTLLKTARSRPPPAAA